MIRSPHNLARTFMALSLLTFGWTQAHAFAYDHGQGAKETVPDVLVFTHGDTKFARFDDDGNAGGIAADILQCASDQAGIKYEFAFAPLSRADAIVNTMEHAVWFPSGMSDEPGRRARMIGPIGVVDFVWYQRKNDTQDPRSEDFRNNALVTAYKGSAFENKLRREGYRWTEGSADHNRLISMVLSDKVDALLAVDFTFKLEDGMRRIIDERIKITPYDGIPVYFQVSRFLAENEPALIEKLRTAVASCTQK